MFFPTIKRVLQVNRASVFAVLQILPTFKKTTGLENRSVNKKESIDLQTLPFSEDLSVIKSEAILIKVFL